MMEKDTKIGILALVVIIVVVCFLTYVKIQEESKAHIDGHLNQTANLSDNFFEGKGQEFYFNEYDNLNGSLSMSGDSRNFIIWEETPQNYLMINPKLQANRTWDWEIKLICNSTDIINFKIEYEDYELNYTLKTLCEELG